MLEKKNNLKRTKYLITEIKKESHVHLFASRSIL